MGDDARRYEEIVVDPQTRAVDDLWKRGPEERVERIAGGQPVGQERTGAVVGGQGERPGHRCDQLRRQGDKQDEGNRNPFARFPDRAGAICLDGHLVFPPPFSHRVPSGRR